MKSNSLFEVRMLSRDTSLAMDEIRQCVAIQKAANWYLDIVPTHVLRANTINLIDDSINLGYVLVAVKKADNSVVGFAMVTFTSSPGKHWGHELVISPTVRSQGVGLSIAKAVKAKSLELGGRELCGTYDPFEGQIGRLYLTKCGAKAIRVYENLYGDIKSLALGNRKTHRFLVKWDLYHDKPKSDEETMDVEAIPIIADLSIPVSHPKIRVEIPYRMQDLDQQEATQWQELVFPILVEAINHRGYQATYLQSKPNERRNFLILEKQTTA